MEALGVLIVIVIVFGVTDRKFDKKVACAKQQLEKGTCTKCKK